jgi:hypothetical protein
MAAKLKSYRIIANKIICLLDQENIYTRGRVCAVVNQLYNNLGLVVKHNTKN